MSKSIRFLTSKGFDKLIKDLSDKYSFLTLETTKNGVFSYLKYNDIKVVAFNRTTQRVTISELAFILTRRNGVEYSQPTSASLEDVFTRKTLVKRLNDFAILNSSYGIK